MTAPATNRGPSRRATRHAYWSDAGLPPETVPPITSLRHADRSPELLAEFVRYNAGVEVAVVANRERPRRERFREALTVRDGDVS